MSNHTEDSSPSITNAKEHRTSAELHGGPSNTRLKKALLVIFAILVAGPLELLIILYFT